MFRHWIPARSQVWTPKSVIFSYSTTASAFSPLLVSNSNRVSRRGMKYFLGGNIVGIYLRATLAPEVTSSKEKLLYPLDTGATTFCNFDSLEIKPLNCSFLSTTYCTSFIYSSLNHLLLL